MKKKYIFGNFVRKTGPSPLKTWISQSPSNFLIFYSKASQRLKFLKFNQKMQTLLRISEILAENRAPTP